MIKHTRIIEYFKLEEKESHTKEHNEIRKPWLFEMVVLTITTNRLSLVTRSQTNIKEYTAIYQK